MLSLSSLAEISKAFCRRLVLLLPTLLIHLCKRVVCLLFCFFFASGHFSTTLGAIMCLCFNSNLRIKGKVLCDLHFAHSLICTLAICECRKRSWRIVRAPFTAQFMFSNGRGVIKHHRTSCALLYSLFFLTKFAFLWAVDSLLSLCAFATSRNDSLSLHSGTTRLRVSGEVVQTKGPSRKIGIKALKKLSPASLCKVPQVIAVVVFVANGGLFLCPFCR